MLGISFPTKLSLSGLCLRSICSRYNTPPRGGTPTVREHLGPNPCPNFVRLSSHGCLLFLLLLVLSLDCSAIQRCFTTFCCLLSSTKYCSNIPRNDNPSSHPGSKQGASWNNASGTGRAPNHRIQLAIFFQVDPCRSQILSLLDY